MEKISPHRTVRIKYRNVRYVQSSLDLLYPLYVSQACKTVKGLNMGLFRK